MALEKPKSNSWFSSALLKSYFAPNKPVPKHLDEFDVDESIEWIKKHFYGVMKEYSTITNSKDEVYITFSFMITQTIDSTRKRIFIWTNHT